MKVLSTKVLSHTLKLKLNEMGMALTEYSFIRVSFVVNASAKEFIAANPTLPLVFTSKNGYRAYQNLNVGQAIVSYCVGKTTKQLLEEEGDSVLQWAKDSAQLTEAILNDKPAAVIYLSGNLRGDYLPQKLRDAGVDVYEFVVYETELTPVTVNGKFDAVLFFSPSAVRSFWLNNTLPDEISAYGIGPATLSELEKYEHSNNYAPDEPEAEKMIELLIAQNT